MYIKITIKSKHKYEKRRKILHIVERQLATKIDGDVKLPWTAIYTGIPTMPACAFDVTCGKTA